MKTKKTLLLLAALLLLALCLAACQPTYTLTFKVEGTDDMTVSVPKGSRAVAPYVETAAGITLDGWYTDEARTERFDFSAAVSGDILFGRGSRQKATTLFTMWLLNATRATYPSKTASISTERLW